MISLIVAIDRKGGIGRNGDLLFHISADLKRFKALTMGNTIVMGRRTFESLPKGALPGRQNVVITRSDSFSAPGADVVHSVEEALEVARKDVFIIGGAEIYRQMMPLADRLCLTVIDAEVFDADTFFPAIDLDRYCVEEVVPQNTEPRCSFITLRRVRK